MLSPEQTRLHLERVRYRSRRLGGLLLALVVAGMAVAWATRRILFHVVFQSP